MVQEGVCGDVSANGLGEGVKVDLKQLHFERCLVLGFLFSPGVTLAILRSRGYVEYPISLCLHVAGLVECDLVDRDQAELTLCCIVLI